MNAHLIGTVGENLTRDRWLELRKLGIGGSDAPAIVGASEWSSPMSLFLDKLGLVEPKEVNEAMEWGSRLESVVIDKTEEVTGHKVLCRQGFFAHADYPWMLATVDGLIMDGDEQGLYEGKTTGAWRAKAWKDDVPLNVWVQTQHDMAVMDLPWALVAVLIGGNHYENHHIVRDDAYIAQLIALERGFYEHHLVPQVPPAIDGTKASEDALKLLYPEDDGSSVVLEDEAAEALARDYLICTATEKKVAAEKRRCANALKALLGEAKRATIGRHTVTWPTIEREAYTVKASSYRKLDVREAQDE